jgi:glycosyltransferase involved in cell wall biosynthesis
MSASGIKFSLIACTLNRTEQLKALLASLDAQTCRDFELIVVDQNPDDRVAPILTEFSQRFPMTHLRSDRGASRGRNTGMRAARGQVIAFPDDDCWYPDDLLARVGAFLDQHSEYDALTGRTAGERYWASTPGMVTRYNVWKRGIEYAMFFRRGVVERVGDFDETLGPGAGSPYGAGEGTDYLLRALALGFKIYFDPSIEIHHPYQPQDAESFRAKLYSYALGKGRVLHLRNCPAWFNVYQCARPLGGAAAALLRGSVSRARAYVAVSNGIRRGWLGGAAR